MGKEGLRAGWSTLIFIVIFAALQGISILAIEKMHMAIQPTKGFPEISLSFGFINEALSASAVLLATWIMSKVERRGRSYGYGGTNRVKLFLAGLVSGLFLISLLVLSLWKSGLLVIEGRLIFGADVLRYGALWWLAFCLVGLFEESLTRGFLLYTLTRGLAGLYRSLFKTQYSTALGFWTAAVIMSVIFYLGHTRNPGESPVGLLSVFIGGLFFSYAVWRTGSIWWGIGMHAAWDWGQSFLFGVADSGLMVQHHFLATHPQGKPVFSGGTTGPEGSILLLGVLAVGSLIVFLTLPQGRYYDLPASAPESPQPATAGA
jgi:membrane protease YdiL (CAAX protease family)